MKRYSTQCKNRDIYYVDCAISKCGISVGHIDQTMSTIDNPNKAFVGYWPWFAKLSLNGNYFCDGTLLSVDTVLTQATCFISGEQPNSMINQNISVTLGSVRFYRDNIEAQKFSIRQVTPYLEAESANYLHLVRLATPINSTRFIRPVCYNRDISVSNISSLRCTLLGLNYQFDQLESRTVSAVNLDKCIHQRVQANISSGQSQHNGSQLCIQLSSESDSEKNSLYDSVYDNNYSSSGRHLYCMVKFTWYLFGVESIWNNDHTISEKSNRFLLFNLFVNN